MPTGAILACHECDLLQHEVRLAPGGVARCHRCGAQLYRSRPHELDRVPAFTLGAFILYVVSNAFPIVGLSINGELVQATLLGAVRGIYADGDWLVALLVLVTAVIAPFVQMIAMTWLVLLLRMGRVPKNFAKVFRVLAFTRPMGHGGGAHDWRDGGPGQTCPHGRGGARNCTVVPGRFDDAAGRCRGGFRPALPVVEGK
jgi:paraquat-inducible protein A